MGNIPAQVQASHESATWETFQRRAVPHHQQKSDGQINRKCITYYCSELESRLELHATRKGKIAQEVQQMASN
jgi:hypothetical protein